MEQELERIEENGKIGYVCPKCKSKCWYQAVGCEGWVCECVDCELLFDED